MMDIAETTLAILIAAAIFVSGALVGWKMVERDCVMTGSFHAFDKTYSCREVRRNG